MRRLFVSWFLLISTTAAAAGPKPEADLDAMALAGPFANLAAFCQTLPVNKPGQPSDDRIADMTCAPPPEPRTNDRDPFPNCAEPKFEPLPGGVLLEAQMIELRETNPEARPACLLAWRT